MINNIYIENDIIGHPRTKKILSKFKNKNFIKINKYSEVFNIKNQNFRIQKSNPSLILARKHNGFVLPTPKGFGIGNKKNYYFSHMYNCIYDCRYCFLQGMYSSANFVIFVNYEDFFKKISSLVENNKNQNLAFFSGYDCDSLALDNITNFVTDSLEFFKNIPTALIELRTKSTSINPILSFKPIKNCVVAYSLLPEKVSKNLDNKTPNILRRINSLKKLSDNGWKVGLRFDPLIYSNNWKENYKELFDKIFKKVNLHNVHSVSCGPLRFPKKMYTKIFDLYPEEKLFSAFLGTRGGMVSYKEEIEKEMIDFCHQEFSKYLSKSLIFNCTPDISK